MGLDNEPILFSLSHFREIFIEAFQIAGARRILEIGSQYGNSTEKLCAYAEGVGGRLITVDPAPKAEAQEFIKAHSGKSYFQFVQSTSLEMLPAIRDVDAYIIDGDHNYYTVLNELEAIHKVRGSEPWLVFEHDVCWPCGRRDMYYAPERIPAEHRQPYATSGGVTLDDPGIVPGGFGDKVSLGIALREGGPKNGVRTAIEDFLAGHPELCFEVIPVIFGVGVIYSRNAPWAAKLAALLKPYVNSPLLEHIEENRIRLSLRMLRQFHIEEQQAKGSPPEATPGRHKIEMFRVPNRDCFEALWSSRINQTVREQDALFLPPGATEPFKLGGLCVVCGGDKDFTTDFMFSSPDANGRLLPAWRERQICTCGLNCRQRSCFHILTEAVGLNTNSVVYCTEQTTELFRRIRRVFPRAVGSEYLGDNLPLGSLNREGVRNEDITRLTFRDGSFDCIFTLDVMEHVPNYRAGFREMGRVLKPGGKLIMTAPFHFHLDKTVIRASINPDGTLTHHLPEVYHGDPINPKGVLCFNDFGWDIMDDLRAAGFPDATMFLYTAPSYGYIGLQYIILATRQPVNTKCAPSSFSLNAVPVSATKPARQEPVLPDSFDDLHKEAMALCAANQLDKAEPYFRKLTKIAPDKIEGWKGRIDCARRMNHRVLENIILAEATERHPEWTTTLNKKMEVTADGGLAQVEGRS